MRHLIDPLDFTQQEISTLLDLADRIHDDPAAYQEVARHKKLATLFYEPSTRTRLSFEAAMLNLGGHVLGFPSENVSSASKGESVADTIRVVSCYADIVAMRHPKEGAPLRASRYSRIPVINAGDGGHQHPTQTLTDLMTIRRRMGRLDDLTIGLCGDLKFGRTVHPPVRQGRDPDAAPSDLQGDGRPRSRAAASGRALYDPHPAGALFQRRGLPPVERLLLPERQALGAGPVGYAGAAPAAPHRRDQAGRGQ